MTPNQLKLLVGGRGFEPPIPDVLRQTKPSLINHLPQKIVISNDLGHLSSP